MKRKYLRNIIFGTLLVLSFGLGFLISSTHHSCSQEEKKVLKPVTMEDLKIKKSEAINFSLATYFPDRKVLLVDNGGLSELKFNNVLFKKIEKDAYVFESDEGMEILIIYLKPKNNESVLQIRK